MWEFYFAYFVDLQQYDYFGMWEFLFLAQLSCSYTAAKLQYYCDNSK